MYITGWEALSQRLLPFHCAANFLEMLVHERLGGRNHVIAFVGIGDVQSSVVGWSVRNSSPASPRTLHGNCKLAIIHSLDVNHRMRSEIQLPFSGVTCADGESPA